jgi:hypothetical protein
MDILLKTTVRITISFFSIIIISCTEKKNSPSIDGIWTQEGYGRIIQINDSTYTYYNTTENSCLPLGSGKLKERFKIVRFNENELILNPGGIVDYRFKRSDTLPKICEQENLLKNKSPEDNFEIFWNTFNKHYSFFEKRNIDWGSVKKKYLPIAKKIESDKELYNLFVEIIRPFNDGHIKLDVPDSLSIQKVEKQIAEIDKKSKGDVKADIIKKYVKNAKSYNNGVIQWGYLKNNEVGYILVSDMNDFPHYVTSSYLSKKEFQEQYDNKLQSKSPIEQFSDELVGVEFVMEKILKDFANSKSVIIDLRFNGGGYETVSLKLLSYFVDEPKHVLSIKAKMGNTFTMEQKYVLEPSENRYDGQVLLLTSKQTASAAEIFALGALAYPKMKSYGSSTNGIFSEILWKNLPNGWGFSLSNEVYSDLEGNEYEIIGVPVNQDMDYPEDPDRFYKSFYVYEESNFRDLTIEKILSTE